MPAKSRLAALEEGIDRLHRDRLKPPFVRWIEAQDTATLQLLRDHLERGIPLIHALERALNV